MDRKWRYHNDPEYREKTLRQQRERYAGKSGSKPPTVYLVYGGKDCDQFLAVGTAREIAHQLGWKTSSVYAVLSHQRKNDSHYPNLLIEELESD